ncbi:MAG: hypothetical protein QNL04_13450 [SAR324 cluster bacterium]|nr:hypothetical protein [SAR324 cluster bacterium]
MNTKLSISSELMKNNKQANIMSAEKKFASLQTEEGHTLFFSIGNDNIFYLTREVPGSETGWVKSDLSSVLNQYNNGKPVIAKSFEVSQNKANNCIDIALVVTGESEDVLYLAQNIANNDETWSKELVWVSMGYDNTDLPIAKLDINDIYIAQAKSGECIVVDIVKDPNDSKHLVSRYFIDPSKKITGKIWNLHDLAEDLNSTEITSCLGRKSDQLVDGIYTLGKINAENELIYSPLYNVFNVKLPAAPSRLKVPQSASAMASAPTHQDKTGLFVAGDKALFYFAYNAQEDGDSGLRVLQNELFLNVTDLYAHATDTEVTVWGLNQQGQIFYTKCVIGQEATAGAWSTPVPILTGVQQIATFVNTTTNSNVIFAHIDGSNMIQLIQDHETSIWHQRNIVLPSTDINDVLEFNSYSTHVQINGDDNIPIGNLSVEVTSTSKVSIYLDNKFTILTPDMPVKVSTDATGSFTLLQETQTMGVVPYKMKLEGDDTTINVNPMLKLINIMEQVKTGDDLGKVTIQNSDDTSQPLVPDTVSSADKDATAQALQQFSTVVKSLPQDGSVKAAKRAVKANLNAALTPNTNNIWGMSFENGTPTYHEGDALMSLFAMHPAAGASTLGYQSNAVSLGGIADAIESTAGDIFRFLKDAWSTVKNFFVKLVGDVYHFFIEIGEKVYRFVLNCISTVIHTVEFIFNKIKVFFEDLIKWLGFLFQWKDILRTHNVIKNLISCYLHHSVDQIDTFKAGITDAFKDVESRINEWAGLKTLDGTLSGMAKKSGPVAGQDDPQSNYGNYHLKHGINSAKTDSTVTAGIADELEQLLDTLKAAVDQEADIFKGAFDVIEKQIIGQASTLTVGQIIERLLAVLADVLVESVENIIVTSIDIIKILVEGVLDILEGNLDIPVLSWLYKLITGNELSLLDVVCLVIAIPTTLIYKLAEDKAPFPDNATSNALIDAKDWAGILTVIQPQPVRHAQALEMASSAVSLRAASDAAPQTGLNDVQRGFIATMRIVSLVSSPVFIIMNIAKRYGTGFMKEIDKAISIVHGISFYATTLPNFIAGLISNFEQTPFKIVGETVYGLTAVEKLADVFIYQGGKMATWGKITPVIDSILGVAGMVPAIAGPANKATVLSITGCVTTSCWNGNRILSPFAKNDKVFLAKMALIGLFGVGQGVLFVEVVAGAD